MLLISRKHQQSIVIDTPSGPVVVRILSVRNGRVLLGVEAPECWPVQRVDERAIICPVEATTTE